MAYAPVNIPKPEVEKVRKLHYVKLLKKQMFIYGFFVRSMLNYYTLMNAMMN